MRFTVFKDNPVWLLSIPVLQGLGFGFYFVPDVSGWVRVPSGRVYPMFKTSRPNLWGMRFHSPRRGALVNGPGPTGSIPVPVEVTLYPDSGATLNAAGDGWQAILCLDEDKLIHAKAAGGNKLIPLHSGKLDLFFPATAELVSRRLADFPGGPYGVSGGVHVKVASSGSRAPSGDVLLLEGPLHRVTTDPTPDSQLNGYPLSSHGESTSSLDGLDTVFGLFGTPGLPKYPTGPIQRHEGSTCRLSVGDIIDADGELQQRVIDVRKGTRGSGDSRHTLFFVSTERVVDGGLHRRVRLTFCCEMALT